MINIYQQIICLAWGALSFIFIYSLIKIQLSYFMENKKLKLEKEEKRILRALDEPLRNIRIDIEKNKLANLIKTKQEEQLKYIIERIDNDELKKPYLEELFNLYNK